jgi:hypothetical protein
VFNALIARKVYRAFFFTEQTITVTAYTDMMEVRLVPQSEFHGNILLSTRLRITPFSSHCDTISEHLLAREMDWLASSVAP